MAYIRVLPEITTSVEFDAGHRLPNHGGACRSPHGHRYKLEVTLTGPVNGANQFVMDFGELRQYIKELIADWDHAFLVWKGDQKLIEFFVAQGFKIYAFDDPPSVECLARAFCFRFCPPNSSVSLTRVRLYETPNNWADVIFETTKGG